MSHQDPHTADRKQFSMGCEIAMTAMLLFLTQGFPTMQLELLSGQRQSG